MEPVPAALPLVALSASVPVAVRGARAELSAPYVVPLPFPARYCAQSRPRYHVRDLRTREEDGHRQHEAVDDDHYLVDELIRRGRVDYAERLVGGSPTG